MAEPVRVQLIDPICGMRMDPEEAPAVATYDGRSIYFCSETHKEQFLREPEKYLGQLKIDEGA